MERKAKISVVLPCYNPDEKLEAFIVDLESAGIDDIIIVNDGSKKETLGFFPDTSLHLSCTILTHKINRGKGAALKTAFQFFNENRPESDGVVTADCDGQHKTADVLRCGEEMVNGKPHIVIGARDFSLPNVPSRSRKGNKITSMVFRVFVGMKISDTQTGLRAIPKEFIPLMLTIEGNRYEYETNMLLKMRENNIPFNEIKIETVYIDENKTSHFRPLKDSVRIYSLIFGHFFRYTLSSLFCVIVEEIIQVLLFKNISITVKAASPFIEGFLNELLDFLPARVISSVLNYFINRNFVFKDKKPADHSLKRYFILWAVQALVTTVITTVFKVVFVIESAFVYGLVTSLIKLVIFIFSYKIQKSWVFAPKKNV